MRSAHAGRSGIVQFAQHAAQLAAQGHGAGDVKAVGGGRVGDQREAEQPDQRGVLEQVAAQLAHRGQPLVQLDEIGGDIRGPRGRRRAGPGAVGGPLREVGPVERAEQLEVALGHRAGGDEGGEHCGGPGQLGQVGPPQRCDRWGGAGRLRRPGAPAAERVGQAERPAIAVRKDCG